MLHVFHGMGPGSWIVSMATVANMTILGRGLPGYSKSDKERYIVGNMLGEYHSLCTLKTSIADFRKETAHG
jgi:hypothetical protein